MLRRGRLVLVFGAVAAAALFAERAPGTLARVEWFRVRRVVVEGVEHLPRAEAIRAAGVPAEASVWDDPAPWKAGLEAHPLVRSVRVRKRLPGTLVFEVREREPVMLVPTPVLEPVGEDGVFLPVDPSGEGMDLPLARVDPADGDRLRVVASEIARLGRVDPTFLGGVSDVTDGEDGALVTTWGREGVTIRFPAGVASRRLREGLLALADATERTGGAPPRAVDLRWADQVVVLVR